jgi:hypothetical protein
MCVAGGGGGDLKPQALEIHELVWADLFATVARKVAADNCGGEGRFHTAFPTRTKLLCLLHTIASP